mmetsp:Transcript_19506/g.38265  ORF Transcript_19506/g.38265 Transcript_19506/m.38265 type:complete len:1975 (-) Transcript_19506:115-6039(-)
MEKGQPVWLRSKASQWGWVPAVVHDREEVTIKGITVLKVTLRDDPRSVHGSPNTSSKVETMSPFYDVDIHRTSEIRGGDGYYTAVEPFEITLTIDLESIERDELDDIKIRDNESNTSVEDLIGLTHLHEPAILHSLRLRYDEDVIYTSTGPILIAINPFKAMPLYTNEVMEKYRLQGELGLSVGNVKKGDSSSEKRLPPHAYLTADDAYRAMMRGIENSFSTGASANRKSHRRGEVKSQDDNETPTNQSILVSGESGAGKTVTTKIVLNYFAMLSKLASANNNTGESSNDMTTSVEQQVLDSNPILESFGNARTIRNDNSSRFGKYIDIRFSQNGRLTGASIDTYLLEKVRLIRQAGGERNFHVFYQLLEAATEQERDEYFLGDMQMEDFALVNQSGTFDRRDMVSDKEMHKEMLDAMHTMGFDAQLIKNIMRLVVAVLYAGNMTFTETTSLKGETCTLDETEASEALACLLGVSFGKLAEALTTRVLFLREGNIVKELSAKQAYKASEALIKSIYGANFDYIVQTINRSIHNEKVDKKHDRNAFIGVLDIFGFETFEVNGFEQLCINYTNETLQQHFNKHVFKMEQQEYEREGILWKFISFPDNQDVLDLIDMKRTGILAILDEQCIVDWGTDDKFVRHLYTRCEKHNRFEAAPGQQASSKFSIEHYAGPVEYSTCDWIEKNKDQLPAASAELLQSSNFSLLKELQGFVRAEGSGGRGSVATKSVGAKFSEQLKDLRIRIDATAPHYIRCLKPNDDLLPNEFDPKNIVEQLRYSGVLEAVRVSRAGFPTRFHHGIFLSRYYMLGDLGGDGKRSQDISTLVKFIAFHIWEHENQRREAKALLEFSSSKAKKPKVTKKQKKRMNAESNIEIPETKEEFDALDFGTQCAVAGLQLGRTKVFLRREAFDRIESLRAVIYGKSASIIQAQMRGRVQRVRYTRLRLATVKAQAAIRFFLTNLEIIRERRKTAREKWGSTKIQRAYRRYRFRKQTSDKREEMIYSAVVIQSFIRGSLVRCNLEDVMPAEGTKLGAPIHIEPGESSVQIVSSVAVPTGPSMLEISQMMSKKADLFKLLAEEKWDAAIALMSDFPMLAEQEEEHTGRLPLHIVAEHNLHAVVEKVYNLYPGGADAFDRHGRLPIHVAAEHDTLVPLKFLLSKHPAGADTMKLRPTGRLGGGIPLHGACKANASGTVITALLSHNFSSAKKSDANGDLPIHLLLRNGSNVSVAVVQALLDIYPTAATRADMYGDLPLSVALKHECKPEVVKVLLMHNPEAAKVLNGRDGHSPLFLAFQHHANDKTILGLVNHAPERIVAVDKRTGMLPIEMATKQKHSKTIVYDLLRRDMPIDLNEKTSAKLIPHQYSWNHLVSNSNDLYHDVVRKVLEQCTQPQVIALSHVENTRGEIALATATPLCKYEFRVMFRLFHTLEIVDQTPAYIDQEKGTQIYYALRYHSAPEKDGYFTSLYKDDKGKFNCVEPFDDVPAEESSDHPLPDFSKMSLKQKLDFIQNERGEKVIAKLTSRSDIVEAELSMRKDYELSRHYVPAILSIHHTIQHAAYSEAMAEPSYCITMEGADITAENLLIDARRSQSKLDKDSLKSIAIALLHLHERGLVHGDFGSHNAAKFCNRWKILGIGGSVEVGHHTNPRRGFYHPPEAVVLETRNVSLGEKNVGASVVSIESACTYDIWAFGTLFYEAIAGIPLSPYRSARKSKRAMTTAELFKVGQWDDRSLRKALRHIDGDEAAKGLIKKLLHPDPNARVQSMREVLEHDYFGIGKLPEGPSFVKTSNSAISSAPVVLNAWYDGYERKRNFDIVYTPAPILQEDMPAVEEEEEELIEIAPMTSLGPEASSPLFTTKKLEQPETVADFQIRDIDNIATTKFADEAQAPEASGVKPPQPVSLSKISDSNSPKEATVEATPTNDKPNNPHVQPMDARPSPTQSYTLSQRTTPVTNFANPAAMKKKSSSFIVRGIKSKLGKKK